MSKLISFQVPMQAKHNPDDMILETRHGVLIFLRIGTRKVKCVLQERWLIPENSRSIERSLVHYASGMVMADHNQLRRQQHLFTCKHGSYARMPLREAARLAMEEKISTHGLEKVLEIIDGAQVINR